MKGKKLLLVAILSLFILGACNNENKQLPADVVKNTKSADGDNTNTSEPKMFFEETTHNFGDIIYGERVIYGFKFTNIGGSDLVITRVNTSCGCTVGDYPKQPIKPGKTGIIEVTFDSKGRKGIQNKTVTILANTQPNKTTLRIKGNVIEPERQ
jgi:hypothetical protein